MTYFHFFIKHCYVNTDVMYFYNGLILDTRDSKTN